MTPQPFSKSDLCWVVVKVFGAVLVLYSLGNLITAIVGWWISIDTFAAKDFPIGQVMLLVFAPLVFGVYFLRSGTVLYNCLMSVPLDWVGSGIGSMGLSEGERQSFEKWIGMNPHLKERDLIDQIALFRDAQNAGDVE